MKHTQSNDRFVQVDRVNKVKALVFLFIVTVVGGAIVCFSICWFHEIKALLPYNPEEAISEFLSFIKIFIVSVVVIQLILASYFWRIGSRTLALEQFPPPGVLLIRNTKILVGKQARLRGHFCRAFAVVLVAISALFPVFLWNFIMSVIGQGKGLRY